MDYSLPGSSVHGIFQARALEWGTIAFSVNLFPDNQILRAKITRMKMQTRIEDGYLNHYTNLYKAAAAAAAAASKSLQSCLTLCDPRDGSPPGSPIPGILQARTLEWVAISFSYA